MPLLATVMMILVACLLSAVAQAAENEGHAPADLPARLALTVTAGEYDLNDAVVELPLDLQALARKVGLTAAGSDWSVRIVELDADGKVLPAAIVSQYDTPPQSPATAADSSPAQSPEAPATAGSIVWIMPGQTKAGSKRFFHIHFGPGRTASPITPTAGTGDTGDAGGAGDVNSASTQGSAGPVTVDKEAMYQGQLSYCIRTPSATWWYHQAGAGFASLLDRQGLDWLSYRPGGGSAGEYRGIPNMVHPEGYFHPGGTKCRSRLTAAGPLRATIISETLDAAWQVRWHVYPHYARLTVLKAPKAYWFLYEGTPGGKIDEALDSWQLSNGRKGRAAEAWDQRLQSPRWASFIDGPTGRSIFLAHHEDDGAADSYWPMQSQMTVFGFGRTGLKSSLRKTPATFTVGLLEPQTPEARSAAILGLLTEPKITLGEVSRNR